MWGTEWPPKGEREGGAVLSAVSGFVLITGRWGRRVDSPSLPVSDPPVGVLMS